MSPAEKLFSKNRNLPPNTVVYFQDKFGGEIMHGRILQSYPYEQDVYIEHYIVEVWVPVIGDTYLEMRTNMNIALNKEDLL